jgi:hypothetical protein
MWSLVLMTVLLVATPSFAEPSFSEQYDRNYNIFNPAGQYAPDNPFNPANRFDPGNPANRYNPNTPFAPLNRLR